MNVQTPTKENFGSKLGRIVVKYRWLVLIGSLLLAFALASGLQHAGFNNDYRVFFGPDNPQLLAFDALQNKYTKDDNVYVVIEPKNGDVFDREVLMAIEEFVDSAWQTPFSSRVDAITNYQFTKAVDDDMYVDDLISDVENKTDEEIAQARANAMSDPILIHRLINEDASVTGINIVIKAPDQKDYVLAQAEKTRIADSLGIEVQTFEAPETEIATYVRGQAAYLKEKYPNIEFHLSGVIMLSNAFSEAGMGDLSTLIPGMYMVIILTLLFLVFFNTGFLPGILGALKSILTGVNVTISTVMILLFSILSGIGLMSYFGMQLTSVSVSAPTMILTLAVADSIHIIITMLLGMKRGMSKHEAIIESMRVNFMPVFVTSATTIVGFLTMNFSDSPPFRDLGNIAAVGVGMAFILSVTMLISLLAILPMWIKPSETKEQQRHTWLEKLANFVIRRRQPIFYGSLAFALVMIFIATRNDLNEQFVDYFDDSIEFRRDTDFMSENITGIYTVEYSVSSGEEGGISDPEFLKTLGEFEEWFEENPKVVHVNTYTDVARKVNKSIHGDDESMYRLPDNREKAAQYLLLYEMSLPFGLDLNNQINVDKSETRFVVTVDEVTAQDMIDISEQGAQWLTDHGINGESNLGISTAIMFSHLTQRQLYNMTQGGIWAIILISIVLILALKSVRIGLVSMVPNIIPIVMGFGAWFFIDGHITSGLAIVFSITIGIVVDDSVHLLSKYLRARREQGKSPEEAIRYAFSTVGLAIVTTTVVLSAGFLILGQSAFALNSGMAQLSAMTIIFALIVDLLFLPTVLLILDKKKIFPGTDPKIIESKSNEN